ncbi:MAG: ribonuclease, partial [Acidobacteriales bacterium]|nr:ribonuclease [Terriglobales bacterium]
MSKEIYISSTPHETRLAIVESDDLTEIYYERENEYTLAGSIYNGRVTRVLPGMQSSFVDIGLERDAFLYITDFMEEAGDSADFDTNGDHSRGGRSDNRRNGNREPATIEGTVGAPAEDSGNRSERGDRNGRGRGRNDRRRGNRDRQPGAESPQSTESAEAAQMDFNEESDFGPHPDNLSAEPRDNGEIGEGAPGADGSRRWRGRRGRRRGRNGQRDVSAQAGSPELQQDSQQEAAAPEYFEDRAEGGEESGGENEYDSNVDLEAAGESPAPRNSAPIADAYPAAEAGQEDAEPRDRSERSDRGDRGRRNDRGGRNGRGGRDRGRDRDGGQRAPRGFAPRTSHYGVDDAPYGDSPTGDGPVPEPIVLPGESLSKYRKDGGESQESAKAAEPTIILPSNPGFEIPAGWDGGETLPGETLSRRSRPESRESREPRESREHGGNRREHRSDSRAGLRDDHATLPEAFEAEPIELAGHAATQAPAEQIHEPVPPAEYEPTDASASYRVDPAAPSEFRQSAPVIEETQEAPAEFAQQADEHAAEHAAEPVAHEITAIHATGEMETDQAENPVGQGLMQLGEPVD